MKENQAIAENNVSEILANSEQMDMTPLNMSTSSSSSRTNSNLFDSTIRPNMEGFRSVKNRTISEQPRRPVGNIPEAKSFPTTSPALQSQAEDLRNEINSVKSVTDVNNLMEKTAGLYKRAEREGNTEMMNALNDDLSRLYPLQRSMVNQAIGEFDRKDTGQFRNENDSTLENIAEIFDPTGITSWDDARAGFEDMLYSGGFNPMTYPMNIAQNLGNVAAMASAVPVFGKVTAPLKMLRPAARAATTAIQRSAARAGSSGARQASKGPLRTVVQKEIGAPARQIPASSSASRMLPSGPPPPQQLMGRVQPRQLGFNFAPNTPLQAPLQLNPRNLPVPYRQIVLRNSPMYRRAADNNVYSRFQGYPVSPYSSGIPMSTIPNTIYKDTIIPDLMTSIGTAGRIGQLKRQMNTYE